MIERFKSWKKRKSAQELRRIIGVIIAVIFLALMTINLRGGPAGTAEFKEGRPSSSEYREEIRAIYANDKASVFIFVGMIALVVGGLVYVAFDLIPSKKSYNDIWYSGSNRHRRWFSRYPENSERRLPREIPKSDPEE